MRLLKWVSLGLGALVALVVLGVLVIVWLVDPNSFKSNIESRVRAATGRDFTLAGDIELGFFPWLSLRSARADRQPKLSACRWCPGRARFGVKLIQLLRGDVIADRIFEWPTCACQGMRTAARTGWAAGAAGRSPCQAYTVEYRRPEIENSHRLFIDEGVPRHRNRRPPSDHGRNLARRAAHRYRNRRRATGRLRR